MVLLKRFLLALLKATSINLILSAIQQFINKNLNYSYFENSDLKPESLPSTTLRVFKKELKIPKRFADFLKSFAEAKKLGPALGLFSFIHSLIFDFGLFEDLIISLSKIATETCTLSENVPEISPINLTIPVVDEVLDSIWKTGVYTSEEQEFLGSAIKIKLLNSVDGLDAINDLDNLQNCTKSILIIAFLLKWIWRFNPSKFKSLLRLLLDLLKKGKLSEKAIRLLFRFLESKGLPTFGLLDLLD